MEANTPVETVRDMDVDDKPPRMGLRRVSTGVLAFICQGLIFSAIHPNYKT